MRWSGQEITVEQAGTLPGLAKLNNLVRSVQTPEFAGITFHEVLAKTALNHVPGASKALPFGWTINPYRGCSHACAYCVSPDTLVLMADGRQKAIRDVVVGDAVMGTEMQGTYRRYVETTVRAKWGTRKRAFRVTLADGTELTASADHRFLTDHGWKHVRGAMSGAEQRAYLTLNNKLVGFGLNGLGALDRAPVGHVSEPAIIRKLDVRGRAVKSTADLRIVSIEDLGVEIDMIDITTGTEDFIANGVVAHNCFARPTHEYLDLDAGKDFDSQIIVKVNVAEVVAREVARPSWQHHTVALGTNTDPYQRAEGRYRLMPGIIAALAASGTPLSILTKGTLLRRDLPLLQAAAERIPVDLAMSIAVFDHELQQSIEPGTPTTEARLATIRAATEAGFRCTVLVMPVLPYLTDSVAHLDRAFELIAEAGAVSAVYSALHLRPGVKDWFFLWLEREHPELVGRYRELYRSGAYAPKEYRRWLAGRVKPIARRHGLDRARLDPMTGTVRGNASLLAAELAPSAAATLQPTLF